MTPRQDSTVSNSPSANGSASASASAHSSSALAVDLSFSCWPASGGAYPAAVRPRWATFDCYGTLVDWNAGIGSELGRLFGPTRTDELLERYHAVEPRVQRERPRASYREVMALVLAELAAESGTHLRDEERDALARSLPRWPVFPEVPHALAEARERGWNLVALSNSDRDLIEASLAAIGVPFERAIVASEIGSYKPAHGHWRAFAEATGADATCHVHVAQSHYHDIVPAYELGIPSVWINRLREAGEPPPNRELPDLTGLADVLDELVPPG
jgi:2-haloacid dehalogenase